MGVDADVDVYVDVNVDIVARYSGQDYELRQEMKLRRRDGETNLLIRRGKIVRREEVFGMGQNGERQGRSNIRNVDKRLQQNVGNGRDRPPSLRGRGVGRGSART